jgi:hypothetical protein
MELAAEFTNGSKTRSPVLTLNMIGNGRREFVSSRSVADKREARKVAKELGAKPWNF